MQGSVDRHDRRLFIDGVLTELRARYGEQAVAVAQESLNAPDLLDPIGAAKKAGISTFPVPRNEREAAVRWAREVGIASAPARVDPGVSID